MVGWNGDVGFLAKLHERFDARIHHGDTEFTEDAQGTASSGYNSGILLRLVLLP